MKNDLPESIREMQGKPDIVRMMFAIVFIGIVFCAGLWLICGN